MTKKLFVLVAFFGIIHIVHPMQKEAKRIKITTENTTECVPWEFRIPSLRFICTDQIVKNTELIPRKKHVKMPKERQANWDRAYIDMLQGITFGMLGHLKEFHALLSYFYAHEDDYTHGEGIETLADSEKPLLILPKQSRQVAPEDCLDFLYTKYFPQIQVWGGKLEKSLVENTIADSILYGYSFEGIIKPLMQLNDTFTDRLEGTPKNNKNDNPNEYFLMVAARAKNIYALQHFLEELKISVDIKEYKTLVSRVFRDIAQRTIDAEFQEKANQYEIIMKYLCDHGADINQDIIGEGTALHVAAGFGHKNLVNFFVEMGANINAPDKDQYTPVMLAFFNGQVETAMALINLGADHNKQNYRGENLLGLAERIRDDEKLNEKDPNRYATINANIMTLKNAVMEREKRE